MKVSNAHIKLFVFLARLLGWKWVSGKTSVDGYYEMVFRYDLTK